MKRMLVKTTDKDGKLQSEYIVIKTDFQLFLEQFVKIVATFLSIVGLLSILYYIFGG